MTRVTIEIAHEEEELRRLRGAARRLLALLEEPPQPDGQQHEPYLPGWSYPRRAEVPTAVAELRRLADG